MDWHFFITFLDMKETFERFQGLFKPFLAGESRSPSEEKKQPEPQGMQLPLFRTS